MLTDEQREIFDELYYNPKKNCSVTALHNGLLETCRM